MYVMYIICYEALEMLMYKFIRISDYFYRYNNCSDVFLSCKNELLVQVNPHLDTKNLNVR